MSVRHNNLKSGSHVVRKDSKNFNKGQFVGDWKKKRERK